MQNNASLNDPRSPTSPPPKPQRSLSRNLAYVPNVPAATTRMQDLPYSPQNQRFSLTPQNAGMEIRSSQMPTGQQNDPQLQQRPQATAGAQIKPYVRQEFSQQPIKTDYGEQLAANTSNSSAYHTAPQNSYGPSVSASRCSVPLLPTPRLPLSGTSIVAATLSSPPTTPTNDRQCVHHSEGTPSYLQEQPTAYFEQQMQKFRSGSVGDTAKISGEMNAVFLQRLRDIDENGKGDNNLKLVTYQEWVDMLLKVNESLITNMEQLDSDVAERLEFLQRRVNCRHSQGNELMKCRNDIDTLVKVIQNAINYNEWDIKNMTLETITPAQVFGLPDHQLECLNAEESEQQMRNAADPETVQRNKLLAHVKALAIEVAEKHDDVRELKRQVVCMEDEIQKAQKKIQFKDDVIKELRNDLKRNAKHTMAEMCAPLSPTHLDTPRSETSTLVSEGNQYLDDGSSQFEYLSHKEHEEEQTLKKLDENLNELFEITSQINKQQMEKHRSRLSAILQKSECEKKAAYRKLDYIQRQLIDLETSGCSATEGDCDSGISSKHENNQDFKILEGVRKRLRNLNENTFELKRHVQKLELENSDLSTSLQSVKTYADRNGDILKNVADLLCNMTGKFSYTDVYSNADSQCGSNPFCEAIMDIKRTHQNREAQLLQTVGLKNQKIEELTQALIDLKKVRHLNISEGEDIDNITPPSSLTAQPQVPHRQQQRQSPQ